MQLMECNDGDLLVDRLSFELVPRLVATSAAEVRSTDWRLSLHLLMGELVESEFRSKTQAVSTGNNGTGKFEIFRHVSLDMRNSGFQTTASDWIRRGCGSQAGVALSMRNTVRRI